MDEKSFQKWCSNEARARGWLVFKTTATNVRGFPDLTMINDGRVVFVELKAPTGAGGLSRLQARVINLITSRGVEAYVCASKERFMAILNGEVKPRAVEVSGKGRRQ